MAQKNDVSAAASKFQSLNLKPVANSFSTQQETAPRHEQTQWSRTNQQRQQQQQQQWYHQNQQQQQWLLQQQQQQQHWPHSNLQQQQQQWQQQSHQNAGQWQSGYAPTQFAGEQPGYWVPATSSQGQGEQMYMQTQHQSWNGPNGRAPQQNGQTSTTKPKRRRKGKGKKDQTTKKSQDAGRERGRKSKEKKELIEHTKQVDFFAKSGNIEKANDAFNAMIAAGVWPSTITFNVLIKAYTFAKRTSEAELILHDMEARYQIVPDEGSFNTIVAGYAKERKIQEALRVIELSRLLNHNIMKSYSILLRYYDPTRIMKLLDTLVEQGMKPDSVMINSALKRLCDSSPPLIQDANELLHRACSSHSGSPYGAADSISFSIVIGAKGQLPCTASSLLALAKETKVKIDSGLYASVINCYVSVRPPDMTRVLALVSEMRDQGLEPDLITYNLLMKGYARTKPPKPKEARAVLDELIDKGLKPSIVTYSTLADVYCMAGEVEVAEKLIKQEMSNYGILPNAATYNTLIKGYSRCRCRASKGYCKCDICFCSNPTAAVELMLEMEAKQLVPNVRTANTVLDAFCSSGDFDRAVAIVEQVMKKPDSRCQPTTQTYNVLLNGWSRSQLKSYIQDFATPTSSNAASGEDNETASVVNEKAKKERKQAVIKRTEELLQEMEERELTPDQLTCNTVVNMYVVIDEVDLALETLSKFCTEYEDIKHDTTVYNTILKGAILNASQDNSSSSAEKMIQSVGHTLSLMASQGVAPDIATFNSIVKAYIKVGLTSDAEVATLSLWKKQAQMRSSCAQHNREACCEGHKHNLFLAHDDFDEEDTNEEQETFVAFKPDLVTMRELINGYLSEQKPQEAARIIQEYILTDDEMVNSPLAIPCVEMTCAALSASGLKELGAELLAKFPSSSSA